MDRLWNIDPDHGMNKQPGFLGDSHHSLRIRELFKYYQPDNDARSVAPLNNGSDFDAPEPELALRSSHDPILACFANLTARTLDAKRCVVTLTGSGVTYVAAESTRSLSLSYPHTHEPGDHLMIGGGSVTPSMGGLCEHTIALIPPPPESGEPSLLEIPDLRRHPKYHDVGYVKGWPWARFYAGAPLRTRNGVSIGTVCVLDDKPRFRGLSREQRMQLADMAGVFMQYLEVKKADRDVKRGAMMEMELSRFIGEGMVPEDMVPMPERRDGLLWSESILEERRKKEMLRRRKVEEKRQGFQERQYAKMMKRDKEIGARLNEDPQVLRSIPEVLYGEELCRSTPEMRTPEMRTRFMDRPDPPSRCDSTDSFQTCAEGHAFDPQDGSPLIVFPLTHQQGILETSNCLAAEEQRVEDQEDSLVQAILRPASSPSLCPNSDVSGRSTRASSQETNLTDRSTAPSVSRTNNSFDSDTDFTEYTNSVRPPISRTVSDTSILTNSDTSGPRRRSNYEKTVSYEPHFRTMFSRAATLIRNAVDANVVFIDGDLEGLFGPDPDRLEDESDTPTSASHVSTDTDAEAATRAHRPKSLRRKSGILGYATASGSSSSRYSPEHLGFDVSELDERTLHNIAEEHPDGQIIAKVDEYIGREYERTDLPATESVLQKFLPESKSVIIVPLFDHNRKLFAVCFAWTCCATRTFAGDIEGNFVKAVVNSVTSEMTRLNILSADKAKGEFISSISHELRSPLHGILASAEFLSESKLDADQRSFVDTVISCGITLLDTVNLVLDFQKLNSVQQPEKLPDGNLETVKETPASSSLVSNCLEDTDLGELVQDVTEGACLGYGFKGFSSISGRTPAVINLNTDKMTVIIDIDKRCDGQIFRANPAAFRRIINNLVGNALKYNKESGWVRVALTASKKEGMSNVKLTVEDSGKGISREFLKTKLFTPFSQENPLSAGAGLGMSIVRQLVGLMRGKIDVKSQVGVGTTVTVEVMFAPNGTIRPAMERGLMKGKSVRLEGFEEADWLLRDSIRRYTKEFFGMKEVAEGEADIVIANETEDRPLSGDAPVIILCRRQPKLASPWPRCRFVRTPCGPKKLQQALQSSLENRRRTPAIPRIPKRRSPPKVPNKPQALSAPSALRKPTEFSLPGSSQDAASPTTSIPPAPSPTSPPPSTTLPNILAVEDNPINLLLLTTFLRRHHYPFATATNGDEALDAISRHPRNHFSVILMDIQMPVLSGIEATRELRGRGERGYVVALTGLAAESDRREAYEAGVDEFVVKPVRFGELERLILRSVEKMKEEVEGVVWENEESTGQSRNET